MNSRERGKGSEGVRAGRMYEGCEDLCGQN